ncbi:hypothetical protein MTR_4g031795 [Medicago truncatula]|uniref:Uncharacterized protein n=1 Tax=Medicago truncatula TaxID=3880 RepID=A0A072UII2_MEDTR|nr:hypothetical protein MTR_4g031795 [Medicago truncatula]
MKQNIVILNILMDIIILRLPLREKIKGAVFDMNGDAAPGPDGFGGANINLWTNNWLDIRLVDLLYISPTLHTKLRASVADVIMDGAYSLPAEAMAVLEVASRVSNMVLPTAPLPDALVWLHWSDALVHTIYDIWLTQNSLRFTNLTAVAHSTKARIHAAINFSGNISAGKCIASDANILDAFSVSSHNHRVSDILMVSWKAPSPPG